MADLPRLPKFGETLMDRLETNPRAPLDAASVSWIDDAGNAYDNFGQKMWSGTASAQPQSWSEWGINALQAPVRIGASLLDSINPYHENEHPITEPDASNWRVPPLATETWNAITAPGRAYYDGMSPEEMQHTAERARLELRHMSGPRCVSISSQISNRISSTGNRLTDYILQQAQ